MSKAILLENIKFSGGELLSDELDKVMLYRRNRTKLALLLLIIIEKCHAHGIQHNDLSRVVRTFNVRDVGRPPEGGDVL